MRKSQAKLTAKIACIFLTLILIISSTSVAAVDIALSNISVKPTGNSPTPGTLVLSGDDDMARILQALKNGYESQHPGITLDIRTTSDYQGLSDLINGNCDIALYTGPVPIPYIFVGPANLTATKGIFNDKIRLKWTAANGAAGYYIYRSNSPDYYTASKIGTCVTAFYDDTTAEQNSACYYWVKSYDSSFHESYYSNIDLGWRGMLYLTYTAQKLSLLPGEVDAYASECLAFISATWNDQLSNTKGEKGAWDCKFAVSTEDGVTWGPGWYSWIDSAQIDINKIQNAKMMLHVIDDKAYIGSAPETTGNQPDYSPLASSVIDISVGLINSTPVGWLWTTYNVIQNMRSVFGDSPEDYYTSETRQLRTWHYSGFPRYASQWFCFFAAVDPGGTGALAVDFSMSYHFPNGEIHIPALYSFDTTVWDPYNPINYNSMPVHAEKRGATFATDKVPQRPQSGETPLSAFQGVTLVSVDKQPKKIYRLYSRNSPGKARLFKGAV
jgi:hypothetical protein